MKGFDISAAITLHREGIICVASLRSYLECCETAARAGRVVQRIAVLDGPDKATTFFFGPFASKFDLILEVDLGDQAAARNTATEAALGTYMAFFDGDDLWGSKWLVEAASFALGRAQGAVFHPELCYVFCKSDFTVASVNEIPHPSACSCFLVHPDSLDPDFSRDCLYFNNVWTSNSFGLTQIYREHPFPLFRRECGFGIEDWAWNFRVLDCGIAHRVVPDTVHMVRIKQNGSAGQRNLAEGLLPDLWGR